ncbi:MAG: DUF1211 domain-containing protein [Bacteroidetes bacterium]|nr:MAG: DUF1211 domain-containing protein [Bacteroidota bacterium]MBL1145700.1 DUF1211 domain-containing protein [Bacteroidota bacterium]MCB0802973.1 DUF1211 domain-containing protein [Flavobacteriales bacterium]NOG58494.1 DUF1211 domain-containing protein [Bacteroidota bacterium]
MKFLHNISRVEALSDGVFAFAATLLAATLDNGQSDTALNIDTVSFASFFISFFILILLWKAHYNFFRRTNYMDNWVIAFNAVFLFSVLYFIFPLKSILYSIFRQFAVTQDSLSNLFELYGSAIFFIFLSLSIMYYYTYKKDQENLAPIKMLFYARHFGIFVFIAAISILLSYLKIGLQFGLSGMIYMLLGPICWFHGVWSRKRYGSF